MIILIIYGIDVAVRKLEYDPPIAAYVDCPLPFLVTLEWVHAPTRDIHILNCERRMQGL